MRIKPCICVFIIFFAFSISNLGAGDLKSKSILSAPSDIEIVKGIVKKGDTASSLLNTYLPLKTIYALDRASCDIFSLQRITAGRPYKFVLSQGHLVKFEYETGPKNKLVIQKQKKDFSISLEAINYDVRLENVSAEITSSLFAAVRKSGEKSLLAIKLADIFAWDIDFIRDIRPGDNFQVLVEKQYQEGQFAGYGKIQAAMFTNRGVRFTAFLHKNADGILGYYDEKGNSLEKAFLKAPLAFSRISSKFTLKRMHPILKKVRSHPAVDYAAPTGTPIKTVGDGVIAGMGFSKSMGNHVIIRHCQGYVTRYYHMSKFGKGMAKNKRVRQGDIIGFVGMTGYATGPHLCFRMKKDGKPIDPLTHKSPPATPVNPGEMKEYIAKTQQLFKRLLMAAKPLDKTSA